jgi:ABC-type nitrate/sulfonate/bicarbonate transport system permease component
VSGRSQLHRGAAKLSAAALPIAGFLLLWQAVITARLINSEFLPSPLVIGQAGWNLVRGGELASDLGATLLASFGGLAIATVIGVPLGIAMAKSALIDSLFGPLVRATYSLPKTALVPLFFLWFGIGLRTNMIAVALACMLPLLVYTFHGVRAVPKILIWSAQCMGTPPSGIFTRVVLPAAMRSVLTGFRIAMGFSFVLAIAAEMIAARSGIGKLMVVYGESGSYDYMFAAVAAVVVIAFLSDRALVALNAYLLRWDEPAHAAGAE